MYITIYITIYTSIDMYTTMYILLYIYIIGARLFVQSSHDPTNTEEGKVDIDFSQPNPNLSITIGKYIVYTIYH